jgi:hypothetical protein
MNSRSTCLIRRTMKLRKDFKKMTNRVSASFLLPVVLTTLSLWSTNNAVAFTAYSNSKVCRVTRQASCLHPYEITNIAIGITHSRLASQSSPMGIDPLENTTLYTRRRRRWLITTERMSKTFVSSVAALFIAFSASATDTSRDISGQDWSNGNYEQKDFSGIVAVGTNFQTSNLQGCNFDKAILINADLSGADIRGASFKDAVLDGTSLKGANAAKAIFSASILDVGSLENSDLTDSLWPSKLQIMMCDMPTLKGTSSAGVDTRDSILCSY